jgi:hypothetical protein
MMPWKERKGALGIVSSEQSWRDMCGSRPPHLRMHRLYGIEKLAPEVSDGSCWKGAVPSKQAVQVAGIARLQRARKQTTARNWYRALAKESAHQTCMTM